MTRCLLIALLFCLLGPPPATALPPDPQVRVRVRPIVFDLDLRDLPDSTELAQLDERRLRRILLRTRGELRSRRLAASLAGSFPGRDSTSVREEFGVELDPRLARFGDARIRQFYRDVIRVVRDVRRIPTGSRLRRVPFVPDLIEGDIEVETHLAMSTAASVIGAGASVAAIVHVNSLHKYGDTWYLDPGWFEDLMIDGMAPCEFVEFHDAPVAEVAGTAFLIQQDKVATAAHVADTPLISTNYFVVFGYAWELDGSVRMEFTDDDVYQVEESAVFWVRDGGRDAAVLQLDRPVVGREPLTAGWPKALDGTEEVYAMGHPYGLPLVEADKGEVLENMPCNFFSSDIEVARYSSGSPVLNTEDDSVVGIVNADFSDVRAYCGCWADSPYLPSDGRPGVLATRIGVVSEYLDHGDVAHVFNELDSSVHAFNAGATSSDADDLNILLGTEGPSEVPADLEVELLLDEQCVATLTTARGETWFIRKRDDDRVEVLRCPQDGLPEPD